MAQKELENIGWKDINITIEDEVETVFVGYDTLETQSRVLKIFSMMMKFHMQKKETFVTLFWIKLHFMQKVVDR